MQGTVSASDMGEEEITTDTHQQKEVPKDEGRDDYYGHPSNVALFNNRVDIR